MNVSLSNNSDIKKSITHTFSVCEINYPKILITNELNCILIDFKCLEFYLLIEMVL